MERSGCAVAASTSMPLARASDERPLSLGHHQLVPQLRRELTQEEEGDHHDAQADDARDDELVLPRRQVARACGWPPGWRHSAPMVGPSAQNPMATPRPIWGEKSRMRAGRRDEDHALDEPDDAVGRGEPELVADLRDGEELDQRDQQRSEDREVGPPDLVGQPADEGAERADGVRDDQQVQEELERHVVVGQQQRCDRALHVVEVVEHDRREHDDGQVARGGAACWGTA